MRVDQVGCSELRSWLPVTVDESDTFLLCFTYLALKITLTGSTPLSSVACVQVQPAAWVKTESHLKNKVSLLHLTLWELIWAVDLAVLEEDAQTALRVSFTPLPPHLSAPRPHTGSDYTVSVVYDRKNVCVCVCWRESRNNTNMVFIFVVVKECVCEYSRGGMFIVLHVRDEQSG